MEGRMDVGRSSLYAFLFTFCNNCFANGFAGRRVRFIIIEQNYQNIPHPSTFNSFYFRSFTFRRRISQFKTSLTQLLCHWHRPLCLRDFNAIAHCLAWPFEIWNCNLMKVLKMRWRRAQALLVPINHFHFSFSIFSHIKVTIFFIAAFSLNI